MTSTFLGLNTAVNGLMAAQNAMDTAGHNIDNANTPGYSRQRVDLVASPSLQQWGLSSNGPGQLGTGVQVQDITRLRSQFFDSQYRNQNQSLGQAQVQQDTLNQVTSIINEPSSTGISNALQNFWNAWDTLQSNPSDVSARTEVQQSGVSLTQTLNQTANQLSSLHGDVQNSLSSRLQQANSYISQIAQLTNQIQKIQPNGNNPNDLMDKRDQLVDKLSQLSSVAVTQSGSSYQVSVGGAVVVSNGQAGTMSASATSPQQIQATYFNTTTQAFDSTQPNTSLTQAGGALQGTLDSLGYVQSYQTDLNNIAQALAGSSTSGQGKMNATLVGTWSVAGPTGGGAPTFPVSGTFADGTAFTQGSPVSSYTSQNITTSTNPDGTVVANIPAGATVTVYGINGLQQIGFSQTGAGKPLFTTNPPGQPLDATNISIGLTPPDIAAGTAVQPGTTLAMPGDGTLAGAVSAVKDATTTFPSPANPTQTMTGTIDNYLQGVVGQLGIQGQTANNDVTNGQALVQQMQSQRQSVSGVSLDQEMSNVVQFQQAYNASAKIISTINQMLQTLLANV